MSMVVALAAAPCLRRWGARGDTCCASGSLLLVEALVWLRVSVIVADNRDSIRDVHTGIRSNGGQLDRSAKRDCVCHPASVVRM